ncbi:hypothetical protein [Archaeoglobus sp.]
MNEIYRIINPLAILVGIVALVSFFILYYSGGNIVVVIFAILLAAIVAALLCACLLVLARSLEKHLKVIPKRILESTLIGFFSGITSGLFVLGLQKYFTPLLEFPKSLDQLAGYLWSIVFFFVIITAIYLLILILCSAKIAEFVKSITTEEDGKE